MLYKAGASIPASTPSIGKVYADAKHMYSWHTCRLQTPPERFIGKGRVGTDRQALFTAKNCLEIRSAAAGTYNSQNSLVSLPALLNGREARCYRGVVFVVMHKLDALRVNRPAALKAKKCPYSLIRAVD